jgi:hypothetical protein
MFKSAPKHVTIQSDESSGFSAIGMEASLSDKELP